MTRQAYTVQLKEELSVISNLGNVDELLGLTKFLGKLKYLSVVKLFTKVAELSGKGVQQNEKFQLLVEFLVDKWVAKENDMEQITDKDRLTVLKALVQIDYSSKRLIGATADLIMENKFEHFSSISHYLQCIALLKYQP